MKNQGEWKKNKDKKKKEFSLPTQIIIVAILWLPVLYGIADVISKK